MLFFLVLYIGKCWCLCSRPGVVVTFPNLITKDLAVETSYEVLLVFI